MSNFWQEKRVLCTGGNGFLGTPLCERLRHLGAVVIPFHADLRNKSVTHDMFRLYGSKSPIDIVFHLAADVGGIADNISRPAEIYYNNVILNTNLVEACARYKVGKVIALGSSCAYPKDASLPFVESDYLKGEPEPTNAPYAYSKRLLLTHLQSCHTQYGLNFTYLILANLYGEGCETNPEKAHVIGALVRKFYEAKREGKNEVTLWGTGETKRDFLYIRDAVEALLLMGEHEAINMSMNIGNEAGISINTMAFNIARMTGYNGVILWDSTKPDGQARRELDCSLMDRTLHWSPAVNPYQGLQRTVSWYASTQKELSPA